MQRRIVAVITAGLVAGCATVKTTPVAVTPDLEARTHAALRERLRDPESARFGPLRAVRTGDGDTLVCGQFNARNGFGGYSGPAPYAVAFRPDGTLRDTFAHGATAAAVCHTWGA